MRVGPYEPKQVATLHLDGWRRMNDRDLQEIGIAPSPGPQEMWQHLDTGAFFAFREHRMNPTEMNIKTALAAMGDRAMNQGVIPTAIEQVSMWGLPAFKVQGDVHRLGAETQATYLYALGKQASYAGILFERKDGVLTEMEALVSIRDEPNPNAEDALSEVVTLLSAQFSEMQEYAERMVPRAGGGQP